MAIELKVRVLSPSKPIADVSAESVILPGVFGYLELLVNHSSMISGIGLGELSIRKASGEVLRYFISGGYFEVHQNEVSILAEVVESEAEIDKNRAVEAYKRAEDRLIRKDQAVEVDRALDAVARSQARLGFLENKLLLN